MNAMVFTTRRGRHQPPASTGGAGAAILLRYLDLDALRAAVLRLEPITADDMRLRLVICSDVPARTDWTASASMIREARLALGLAPDA